MPIKLDISIWNIIYISLAPHHPLSLSPCHLVAVMAVKNEPNPEELWTGFHGECGWWTWLGELSPPGSRSKILFMLTLGIESLRTHLEWTYTRKADLNQLFPRSRSRMSSTDPWNVVLGLRAASRRCRVLQTEWYMEVEWDAFWTCNSPSRDEAEGC